MSATIAYANGVDVDPGIDPTAYCECGWTSIAATEFTARRQLAAHLDIAHPLGKNGDALTGSQRLAFWVITREPWASRATCANEHPWTNETTRWRRRTHKRGTHSYTTVERDCLVCKHKSEGRRKKRRASERRYM